MDTEVYLIVGLGNPGQKYAHTRHNVGFDVTNILADRWHVSLDQHKMDGAFAELRMEGKRVVLCQPQTFMNLSGDCVRQLLNWYKCPLQNLLIIYDDIDLPAGRLRVRKNGSAGTHNGMRSIIANTASPEFPRIRVGVGAKPEGWDLADWVLSHYLAREEQDAMAKAFVQAADCVEDWLKSGIEHAMQQYNRVQA